MRSDHGRGNPTTTCMHSVGFIEGVTSLTSKPLSIHLKERYHSANFCAARRKWAMIATILGISNLSPGSACRVNSGHIHLNVPRRDRFQQKADILKTQVLAK